MLAAAKAMRCFSKEEVKGSDAEQGANCTVEMPTGAHCGNEHAQNIDGNDKKQVKGQLDHFYDKAQYPYLAILKYNLIPSCPFCNGPTGKHSIDAEKEGLISPFMLKDVEAMKFHVDIKGSGFVDMTPGGKAYNETKNEKGSFLMKSSSSRYALLDELRGLDLISMMLYHGMWDAVYLFGVVVPWYSAGQGRLWQQSICWVFILLSGFCLPLGHHPLKRGAAVFGAGALVTAVTLLFMPENVVWFGVLTLLGSAMLLTGLVQKCERCRTG